MQRTISGAVAAGLLACHTLALGAPKAAQEPALKVSVELADGSRLIGQPALTELLVHTAFADITLPLKALRDLARAGDQEAYVLHLQNGDTLTGTLNLPGLELQTLLGLVRIPLSAVRHLEVSGGKTRAGLMLYYRFDDDGDGKVFDQSGQGRDGQTAGQVLYEPSFAGKAIRFTAPDSYVVCADETLNVNGWKQVTVAAWIQFRQVRTYGCIVSRCEVTGEQGGGMALFAGGRYGRDWHHNLFRITDGEVVVDVNGRGFDPAARGYPQLGRWYHLAGTYDGKQLCLYIDGALQASREAPHPDRGLTDHPATKLVIGTDGKRSRITSWTDVFFDGLVDELQIYNRALSADEIRSLYRDCLPQVEQAHRDRTAERICRD